MKIERIEVIAFETSADRISFGRLLTGHKVVQTLTKVITDEGAEGYYFGGTSMGIRTGCCLGTARCSRASSVLY